MASTGAAHVGDRLGQALAPGPELLDLGVEHLAATGQVGEHPGPELLGLLDHDPALGPGPLGQLLGVGPHLVEGGGHLLLGPLPQRRRRGLGLGRPLGQQRVGPGLGLVVDSVASASRRSDSACASASRRAASASALATISAGGVVGALEDPGRLLAHRGGQHGVVDDRVGGPLLGFGQGGEQLLLAFGQGPQPGGQRLEVVAHLGRVEAPADGGEGVPGHVVGGQVGRRGDGQPAFLRHGGEPTTARRANRLILRRRWWRPTSAAVGTWPPLAASTRSAWSSVDTA